MAKFFQDFTFGIDTELLMDMEIFCIENKKNKKDFLNEAIASHLKSVKGKPKKKKDEKPKKEDKPEEVKEIPKDSEDISEGEGV